MVTVGCSPRMMAQKAQVAGISREPTAVPGPVPHVPNGPALSPLLGFPLSLRHWLRVGFVPAAVIRSPCWVTLMFLIVTPAGSFGMLMSKFTRLPRTLAGTPPKLVILMLILLSPTWVTW